MLVGREADLAVVGDLVAAAHAGAGQAVLLEGEAGIGKSALLDACAQRCGDHGFAVLVGRADELGATRPFAPLLDAFADGPQRDAAGEAVRRRLAAGRTAPVAVVESDPGLQSLLIDDLATLIEDLCVSQPVALCLDDLHWADASTLATLAALVRRSADLPLLLVLAARPVPRSGDLEAFVDLLSGTASGVAASRIQLGRLDAGEADELTAAVLGARPGPGLRGLLDGCAGNPLLIVEMLASLRDAGLLATDGDDVDTAGDPAALQLPTSLTETVRRRMARLDDKLQAVATIAALLGSRFTLTDLATVTSRPTTEVYPLVQTLVEARLFVDDSRALAYRHDLVREAVLSALPESVRVDLHRGIAAALQAAGAPIMRVAEQLALGAEPGSAEAVSVLREAAEEISAQDPAGAESLLRRALELCDPMDPQRDLVSAHLVDAMSWGGRLLEAEATASEVLSRPVQPEAEIALRSALSRSLLLLARPLEAIPHEERLIELHHAIGRSTAWPLAESASCRVFGLDLDGAVREADEAVRLAEEADDTMATILGLSVQSFARTASGESALAVALATRAVTLADATPGGEGHRIHPNLFRGIALQSLGHHADAGHALDRGRTLGEHLGSSWALPIYHFLTALGHWDRGEWDDLLTEIDAGVTQNDERAFSIGQAWAYGVSGRVLVHRGELERATVVLDRGDQLIAERGAQFGVDWIVLARSLLLEAQGRRQEGLELLSIVWEAAAGLQAAASLVLVGGDLARLAVDAGDEGLARRVVDELAVVGERTPDDLVVRGRERRARALVEHDLGAMAEAVTVFDELGHRFETAVVRAELADLLAAAGDRDAATAAYDEALTTLEEIGATPEAERVRSRLVDLTPSAPRRPTEPRAVSGWEALTPTEHLIVEEVCGGRSNPQVAERLGISRRTVDAHLRSIYTKLDITTRLALAVAHHEREPADGGQARTETTTVPAATSWMPSCSGGRRMGTRTIRPQSTSAASKPVASATTVPSRKTAHRRKAWRNVIAAPVVRSTTRVFMIFLPSVWPSRVCRPTW